MLIIESICVYNYFSSLTQNLEEKEENKTKKTHLLYRVNAALFSTTPKLGQIKSNLSACLDSTGEEYIVFWLHSSINTVVSRSVWALKRTTVSDRQQGWRTHVGL